MLLFFHTSSCFMGSLTSMLAIRLNLFLSTLFVKNYFKNRFVVSLHNKSYMLIQYNIYREI